MGWQRNDYSVRRGHAAFFGNGPPTDGNRGAFAPTPAAERAVADLAARRIDVAVLWGPQAGFFAARSGVAMRLSPPSRPPTCRIFTPWAVVWGSIPVGIALTLWFWPRRRETAGRLALEQRP